MPAIRTSPLPLAAIRAALGGLNTQAVETDLVAAAEAKGWIDPYIALAATDHRRNLAAAAGSV